MDDLKNKIIKYNKMISETELLRYEIEKELDDKYSINDGRTGFGRDDELSIYSFGSNEFDINIIEKIIAAMKSFEKEVGESPDISDLIEILKIN